MVTTRARNGIVRTRKSPAQEEDYEMESAPEDSGDEPEPQYVRPAKASTPNKRQKTAKSRTGSKTQRKKDLSLLPTMPTDVFFEILSQLKPLDLLALSRTNREFRTIMFAPNTRSVWIAARKPFLVPDPPSHISEVKWASLLFETACQSCGTKGVPAVDWQLLKRICKACKSRHLVYQPKLKKQYPQYESAMFSYMLYTNVSAHSHGGKSKFFWDEDIVAHGEKWNQMKQATKKADREVFEAWKKERLEYIETLAKAKAMCERAALDLLTLKLSDTRDDRLQRLNAVKERFLRLGYLQQDVDLALNTWTQGIYTGSPDVTDAIWARLRPRLEPLVQASQNRRVLEAIQAKVNARMQILRNLYDEYLDTLKTSKRYLCPPVEILRPLPEVITIVEAPDEVNVTRKDFEHIASRFEQIIAEHIARRRGDCAAIMKSTLERNTGGNLGCPRNTFTRDDLHPVELVESIWSHGHSWDWSLPRIVGWSSLASELYAYMNSAYELRPGVFINMPEDPVFDYHTAKFASTLVSSVGLLPYTVSAAHMDERDDRFTCDCLTEQGRMVFTWRSAIAHHHKVTYARRFWGQGLKHEMRPAEKEEAEAARKNDDQHRLAAKSYSCNHCNEYTDQDQTQHLDFILSHLSDIHQIDEAIIDEDYFVNQKAASINAFQPFLCIPPPPNVPLYACNQCALTPWGGTELSKLRFYEEEIVNHVSNCHGIQGEIVLDRHYRQANVVDS